MKSFAARAFRVVFDDRGGCAASPSSQPDQPYFDGLQLSLRRDQDPVAIEAESATTDVDEVEQHWRATGSATIGVRHSFVAGWRTRIVLANLASTSWNATVRLALQPGAGYRVWPLAVGSAGVLALVPTTPGVPILYARSATVPGLIATAGVAALDVGPIRLGPGERAMLAWEWDTARSPRELAAAVDSALPGLPRWSCVAVDDEIWVPADPDTALVAPEDIQVTDLGDRQALTSSRPGRHPVELRSARGSTILDLSWVTPATDYLAQCAERVLTSPVGPSGIVGLPDLASALVVQRVARTAGFSAATAAADALDQFTARLPDTMRREAGGSHPALAAIYLAGEYDRLGDPDVIDAAVALIAGLTRPVPGLGVAIVRTALAAVLADRAPSPGPRITAATRPPGAAEVELLIATGSVEKLVSDDAVTQPLYRLGIDLLAGLPGRLGHHQSVTDLAHDLVVLRLVPDSMESWWRQRFAITPDELADSRGLELVERLAPEPTISLAHAWLAVGS